MVVVFDSEETKQEKCELPIQSYKEESIDSTIESPDVIPADSQGKKSISFLPFLPHQAMLPPSVVGNRLTESRLLGSFIS
ncbi:hypothetical protein AVEN_141703-1 [Araneus ventricosus]|uniref:Uncharacterized protein n=1 Tax=Araneus ventricosus TaxID=182803 RepID=A0A4Y2JRI9_ARAVE|nr:hypothetical protein AVEN_141703-1 [Araneus ventricosus]